MSKLLEELMEKENNSELELCILWVADDAETWEDGDAPYDHAKSAAAELAALRARIAELERAGIELHNIIDKEPCMVGYEWACEAWRKAVTGSIAALDTRNR